RREWRQPTPTKSRISTAISTKTRRLSFRFALVPRGVSRRLRPDRQRPDISLNRSGAGLGPAPTLFPGVIAMIHASRIASGLAEDVLKIASPAANPKLLIEDAFRRGVPLSLSIRAAARSCRPAPFSTR